MTPDENDDIVTLSGPRITCVTVPSFREQAEACAAQAQPFADWDRLEAVKESTVRSVSRGEIAPGLDIHLKLYRAVRLSDRARDAIGGARAVKEFERLHEARRRGLPCVEPLCAGRWQGSFGARSFLITRSVDAEPLPTGPLPPELAERAGQLLRQAHDAGLQAFDLHPGNMLVAADGALTLCDLTSAVLANPLENDERAKALAFFCQSLDRGLADPAAAALVAGYGASPKLVDEAARAGRRLRHRALGAFGRRAGRACRHTRLAGPDPDGARWFVHEPADPALEAARAWLAQDPRPEPLRQGRRGAVWLDDRVVVKQRPTAAARRLFRAAYWLEFSNTACARPLALRLHHGIGLVFSERMPNPDLATEFAQGSLPAESLPALAKTFGQEVGRMHALGLRNRDMKFENLVRRDDGRIAIVDLDGIRRNAPLDERGEGADLGRLLAAWRTIGHRDQARVVLAFWRGYHRARSWLGRKPTKRLRRRTEVRAQEWAEAHRSPGGSVSSSPGAT